MAKCKGCNLRIDFDVKDTSAKIGENLIVVDKEPVKVPVFGKFAYVRRGRWYWHPHCYPDDLNIRSPLTDPERIEINKNIDGIKDELTKTLEENSKLIASNADLVKAKDIRIQTVENLKEQNRNLKHDLDSMPDPKIAFKMEEERHRCFDELSIYKTDYEKVKEDAGKAEFEKRKLQSIINELDIKIIDLNKEVSEYHKLQADLKEELNGVPIADAPPK